MWVSTICEAGTPANTVRMGRDTGNLLVVEDLDRRLILMNGERYGLEEDVRCIGCGSQVVCDIPIRFRIPVPLPSLTTPQHSVYHSFHLNLYHDLVDGLRNIHVVY